MLIASSDAEVRPDHPNDVLEAQAVKSVIDLDAEVAHG